MKLNFPKYAKICQQTIEKAGFEASFVGGCVRDGLLGRACDDIDITTNALPEDIISLFPHTAPTGLKHGTVTVIVDGKHVEVTTYRTEEGYSDCRHPEGVRFVTDIKEDLSRRDFTINAMAYSDKTGLIDLFGGVSDLESRIIRTVGIPDERLGEDALRILRAYRFASVLGFSLEKNLVRASERLAHLLKNVSGERILTELVKLSSGICVQAICEFLSVSALSFCGIGSALYDISVFEGLNDVKKAEYKFPLFVSLLCHDSDKIKNILKPDNMTYGRICTLDKMIGEPLPVRKADLKRLLFAFGEDNIRLYLAFLKLTGEETVLSLEKMTDEIIENGEPYNIAQLAIDGNTLKELGFSGTDIGRLLKAATDYVIDQPNLNRKEDLINFLKN